ncbi:putative beta-lysine N-acetyltransferase [uncultured Desulfuromusa sp.]|uniref:putative beta-lysine N-acetyltransferase n=1 Tax=uncultured Desulfuromusa sp. TaxID=219183 RepID=UPI002AA6C892|nr:putative beta-lysine N-acetyltransferase [uncultured Desulfuromusa sp.]
MRTDAIETVGKSVLQYGPENDRVYLMKLAEEDLPDIITSVGRLATLHNYSKAFVKVPESAQQLFVEHGYRVEAEVPGLFNRQEDGFFMARYFHADRLIDNDADKVKAVLDTAHVKAEQRRPVDLPANSICRLANPCHCREMAELYQQTFASYPFPIHDPEYLASTMAENVLYAGVWKGNQLLALASAEIDHQNSHAELTDFATDPDWRGHGLANALLQHLETELQLSAIKTCYTIARATSFGMNICFAQNGYQFAGTLVKNTQIAGKLESMNVWHNSLEVAVNV